MDINYTETDIDKIKTYLLSRFKSLIKDLPDEVEYETLKERKCLSFVQTVYVSLIDNEGVVSQIDVHKAALELVKILYVNTHYFNLYLRKYGIQLEFNFSFLYINLIFECCYIPSHFYRFEKLKDLIELADGLEDHDRVELQWDRVNCICTTEMDEC